MAQTNIPDLHLWVPGQEDYAGIWVLNPPLGRNSFRIVVHCRQIKPVATARRRSFTSHIAALVHTVLSLFAFWHTRTSDRHRPDFSDKRLHLPQMPGIDRCARNQSLTNNYDNRITARSVRFCCRFPGLQVKEPGIVAGTPVLVMSIENNTGDPRLDLVSDLLRRQLCQSPHMHLLDGVEVCGSS